ncbi:MAG TPA: hypothetical protein VFZ28_00655 [Burkholderiaceae bacterium]|nr:hypothetical protein [Burkholderiaceae bacterium]
MTIRLSLSILAAAALAAGCAGMGMDSGPARTVDGALVGGNGMTLYTFDRDAAGTGKSVCNGQCASNWPPLAVGYGDGAHGEWSVVTRDDGSRQWAYKGKPLYYFAKDQKPGDRTGDNVINAWHVARP